MPKTYPYDEKIAQEICDAISSSSKGIKRLCKENPHWPSRAQVFRWLNAHPLFRDHYMRAKIAQIESLIDDAIEIADATENDTFVDEDGTIRTNHDHINRARLRIDTRKWLACKLVPKIYGDRIQSKEDGQDAISQFRVEE